MFDPSFQTIWGGGNLTAVFCDTGWEHPDTYKHVNDVCLQMGVRLITLKSKYDFVSLAVHKKRFPSTNARFCTSELKMKPMIDYVLSLKESCIIIQGIRAGESTARAAMEEECMYFKSYFQPNKKGRTENYRSKDVKEWCSQFDASVLRPIFKWSAQQVIDCILDAGQKPNPLYYRGFSRVGCFPCIMCRHKEIELIAKNRTDMSKYTARQIAESDELFEKQIHKVRKFYLSRNPDKMMMLEERKVVVKERNKGLSPEYDKEYYCGTCGAKDGAEHPKSGYCFHCDTDNWISKNN